MKGKRIEYILAMYVVDGIVTGYMYVQESPSR